MRGVRGAPHRLQVVRPSTRLAVRAFLCHALFLCKANEIFNDY